MAKASLVGQSIYMVRKKFLGLKTYGIVLHIKGQNLCHIIRKFWQERIKSLLNLKAHDIWHIEPNQTNLEKTNLTETISFLSPTKQNKVSGRNIKPQDTSIKIS